MAAMIGIAEHYRETLENGGLAEFDAVMNTTAGRCLRVLPDRENWYLQGKLVPVQVALTPCPSPERQGESFLGMYLKKHRTRTWATRIAAALGVASPPSPGQVEAENAIALQSLGIDVMPLMAYGENLHADGRLESFLLTEELAGYCELQEFIQRRFSAQSDTPSPSPSPTEIGGLGEPHASRLAPPAPRSTPHAPRSTLHADLRRLIMQVAEIARRFHASGFNHRDFYCCHFLVKETSRSQFDVRLIDLQRVQRRQWFRRRWIVKDLAQLASMSPDDRIGCREKILFLRTYLGVQKLRPQDKRLVRDILWKLSLIRRHARHKS